MRQPVGNFNMSFRVLQHNVQKRSARCALAVEGLGVQHTMARAA